MIGDLIWCGYAEPMEIPLHQRRTVGRAFLRWWPPSTMWGGPFNLFMAITRDVWIIPSFFNLGLCAVCWAHFMCHHKLWPTLVSHSHAFSSLNSSIGFVGGKHYQEITFPIFWLVLQNFAIPGCFPYILFYHYLFSLLSLGWFVIAWLVWIFLVPDVCCPKKAVKFNHCHSLPLALWTCVVSICHLFHSLSQGVPSLV